jgi:uncharacterized protein YndB with AHSA1/START domain
LDGLAGTIFAWLRSSGRRFAEADGTPYFVLEDASKNRVMLEPPGRAAPYAGQEASVTGRFAFRQSQGRVLSTKVTVTFEDRDGKTLLTIVQTGFENENDRDGAVEDGWPRILDALERVVAERRST